MIAVKAPAAPSPRWLKLLANYTADWGGSAADPLGIIRVENRDGGRDPLIWVFNGSHEFKLLAAALGPDQPLIGLRSLNAIVPLEQLNMTASLQIAGYYAEMLLPLLRGKALRVGGNCQGALIANLLAVQLLQLGLAVRGFIAQESDCLLPLPIPATLIFGDDSLEFNPFLQGKDPWPRWRQQFALVRFRLVPGKHGSYFSPTALPFLAGHIAEALSLDLPPAARHLSGDFQVRPLPRKMPSDAVFFAEFKGIFALPRDCSIFQHWSHDEAPCFQQAIAVPERRFLRGCTQVRLTAPTQPGTWCLHLLVTKMNRGPISWQRDISRFDRIEILPVSAASCLGSRLINFRVRTH
ncbi:hypothetical protein MASR1M32_28980 [Rhodobacter sp.]